MRRLNIVKNGKIETKSFLSYRELVMFLKKLPLYGVVKYNNLFSNKSQVLLGLPIEYQLASKIWQLNVGKSINHSGFRFSINSKRRVGNQLTDGTTIGAEQ